MSKRFPIFSTFFALLVGIALTVAVLLRLGQDLDVAFHEAQTTATVTEIRGSSPPTIVYGYEINGVAYSGTASPSRWLPRQPVGAKIPIHYSTGNPLHSTPNPPLFSLWVFCGVCATFVGVFYVIRCRSKKTISLIPASQPPAP